MIFYFLLSCLVTRLFVAASFGVKLDNVCLVSRSIDVSVALTRYIFLEMRSAVRVAYG